MIIQGIVPPLVTPLQTGSTLHGDATLDQAGLENLISRQLAAGVDGLFILGTTGEGPSLSSSLQREMIAITCRMTASTKLPIYVGVTDASLAESLALAEFAADQGARAVVAAAPFYFPAGQTELRHWFTLLADRSPLPLILYNMPSCVKIDIETDTLRSLLQHDNIVALKDSSGNLDYLANAVQAAAGRIGWPVLVGPEALLTRAIDRGAVGGVTGGANLCPRLFTSLLRAKRNNDESEIKRLQIIVDELQELYQYGKYGSSYLKGLKCSLELTGICSSQLAPPFDAFKESEKEKVQQFLNRFARHGFID